MKPTDLNEFKEQIKNVNVPQNNQQPQQQIPKNILLSFPSDVTGCGHIRNIFPLMFVNSVFARTGNLVPMVSPTFIFQPDILARTRTIFFQRQMSPEHLNIIKQYKQRQSQFQYKMVWEIDDLIWGHNELQGGSKDDGVPSYNQGWKNITDTVKQSSVEIMKMMDKITVSTQWLADYITNELGVDVPVVVVQNTIPRFFWGEDKKEDITTDIEKPNVLYTGSPTHYNNENKMLGDFDNSFKDWVIKNVNDDKINFTCMGGLPWFFESIKDKIKVINWVGSFNYHNVVKSVKADIAIMPLIPNNFNRGKSDIKYIEHAMDGVPTIGTTFSDGTTSPYDHCPITVPDNVTIEELDKVFWDLCKVERYNKVKNAQYEYIEQNGRILESKEYIDHFVNTLIN